jgi:hypothetical protein
LTADRTKAELEEALLEKKRRKEKIVWKDLLEGILRSEEIHGMPKQVLYYSGNNTESTRTIINFNVNTNLEDKTQGPQCEVE